MSVGLARASTYAIKKEVTAGTYVPPSSGDDFVPLRPANELSFNPEILTSDELLNDIGESKGSIGKQSASGSHSAYLKHSGVEGQEPELGVLYESILGAKAVAGTEYDTIAGSTTSIVKVNTGEGALFQVGQALLVKDSTNGYSIRNVASIVGDDLYLNFSLSNAPGAGVNLGKCVLYLPASSGHPTFSITKYLGNGHAIEAGAGNTVTELSIKADANAFAEAQFSFEGTKYLYNAITISASNKWLDATDAVGTFSVSVPEKTYATPIELAEALQLVLNDARLANYTVSYSSVTGKFTIATDSATLSLLFATGSHAANDIGLTLGFTNTDKTGSLTYTSNNEMSYAMAYTPSYDNADLIVVKGADLFVGDVNDNICICAQSVALKVSKTVEDVDCLCEENGVLEKIPTARSVELTVTAALKKHEAKLLDALLKNSGISAMLNAGPKSSGNWIPGKCFNAYIKNATVSVYKPGGESFITLDLTLKGFVTSTSKDVYLGFV